MKSPRSDMKTVWITNNGHRTKFATNVVWRDLYCQGNRVSWNQLVWFPQNILRHSFVLWLAIQGRLLTQDRIAMWDPNRVMEYVFCKQCLESHEHLFFKCNFTHKIWEGLLKLLDMQFSFNWDKIIEDFSKLKANRNIWSIVRRLVLGVAVYVVWQERNTRLFKNKENKVEVLIQNAMDSIIWRLMSFVVKDSSGVKAVEDTWKVKIRRSTDCTKVKI